MSNTESVTQRPAWQALVEHQRTQADVHMRTQFAHEPDRFTRFSLTLGDILFDYSKNRISDETMTLLRNLAAEAGLTQAIEAMFSGARINSTEGRAVLHVALRNRSNRPILVDGQDVMPAVNRVLAQMRAFSERVRSGAWTGYTGKRITDVVNIGIGGSDLGPKMVVRALTPYVHPDMRFHFVSNVDGTDIAETLRKVNAESVLFLVASKTFTTQETMANAQTARAWFLGHAGDEAAIAKHFVALSTNEEKVTAFGIDPANMFEFCDWGGGRYSLWSAIGLSIVIAVGYERFAELLDGAHAVDEHFRTAPYAQNIPVTIALLGIWYTNFFGAATHAVLPYAEALRELPAYLQQLEMESNGKGVDRDGERVDYATAPVIWGSVGTNSQHAFHQLLHQGTQLIPCDFLVPAATTAAAAENALAQAAALMSGKDAQLPQRRFEGNRPSSTILFKAIDPHTMGELLALYEHKVFVQGVIWNINSFDQWGVELGKEIARTLAQADAAAATAGMDASTKALMLRLRAWRS